MIRFYKNNLPINGDIVVASLKQLEEDNNHRCSLLEYGGIEGVICKVSIKKRDKTFKKLKEGSIFLIVVSNVYEKQREDEITTIDLHYMEIDESLVKTHMSRYQQFMNIINAFTYIVADKKEIAEPLVTFNYADQDENIKAKVNIILEETLYNYSKEDVEKLFFKDTIELHNVATNWIECNKIPNFMEKLM
jgi:translation initiation factor 2 alpha subunit (eIF-2alpha)